MVVWLDGQAGQPGQAGWLAGESSPKTEKKKQGLPEKAFVFFCELSPASQPARPAWPASQPAWPASQPASLVSQPDQAQTSKTFVVSAFSFTKCQKPC